MIHTLLLTKFFNGEVKVENSVGAALTNFAAATVDDGPVPVEGSMTNEITENFRSELATATRVFIRLDVTPRYVAKSVEMAVLAASSTVVPLVSNRKPPTVAVVADGSKSAILKVHVTGPEMTFPTRSATLDTLS